MEKKTWRWTLAGVAVAVVIAFLVCVNGCATFQKGLDELADLADKIEYYEKRASRVFLQLEGFYQHVRPYFVNQCATGEIGITQCDQLAIIDTKIVKIYSKVKDGAADVETILEGFQLAEQALRIQFEALENGA